MAPPIRPALLPAGVHLLPVLRPGDDAWLLVVCDTTGHAIAGPQWIDRERDLIVEASRLLAHAERRDRNGDDGSDGDDGGDGNERPQSPPVWREPPHGREIL